MAVHRLLRQEVAVAGVFDADAAHHLADDHLDVAVVDVDALGAIDPLDLVHQVDLHVRRAEDREHLLRVQCALGELLPDTDVLAGLDADARRGRHGVRALVRDVRDEPQRDGAALPSLAHELHASAQLAGELNRRRRGLPAAARPALRRCGCLGRLFGGLGEHGVGVHLVAVGDQQLKLPPARRSAP